MLYDVTTQTYSTAASHSENAVEKRGAKTLTTIRPTGSPPLHDRAKSSEKSENRPRRSSSETSEAVRFRREETSMHRLYESVRETEETSRQEKVEELRRAFKNGTYRPNLMVVAERMLSLGELGRF